MSQPLFELLHRCTVKISVPDGSWGTGFFVAPGWVMTCAHVVKTSGADDIQVMQEGEVSHRVVDIYVSEQDIDVVVLKVVNLNGEPSDAQACVLLDEEYGTDHDLYVYGFPSDFDRGAPTTGGLCEGLTEDKRGPLIKFRGMQIQPGHSGSALLDRRTGRICGVVNKTRGESTDLGGVAVPVFEIWQQFPEVRAHNQAFHQRDQRWALAMEQRQQEMGQRVNVPYPRNVFFTGREDILLQLHKQLRSGTAASNQTQGLSGLGGIGKTQTAVEYAYRYFEVSYGWVFWLRADTLVNLRTDLAAVATQVGQISDTKMELDEQIQAALGWLNRNQSWLMVVDNADEPEILDQLTSYLPTNPAGRILITSRQAALDMVNVAQPLALETWDRDESVDFLLKRTQRSDTEAEAEAEAERTEAGALAEALRDLPLALEQAAAFIARRKLSFRVYLQQYEKRRLELLEREAPKAGNYPHTVRTTWQLNFEAVAEANPASVDLLQLSAFLAPDKIPYELLILGRQHWVEGLRSALDAEDWDTAVFLMADVLEPLSQYSLIQWESKASRYSVHRMVQEVVRDQMDKTEQLAWANQAVDGMWQSFPTSDRLENWPVCERLLPHGLQLRGWLTHEGVWSEVGGRLLNSLGYFLEKQGQYQLASEIVKQSLEMRQALLGDRHPDVATSLNNLAEIYRAQGRYAEAESCGIQALEMRRELVGDRHPLVATSLNILASLYWSQGCFEEAETYSRQALDMNRELLGNRHPDVFKSLGNLASLYRSQGRYAEAESYFQQALDMSRELLGDRHPDVFKSLGNLALLYQSQGRYTEAESYYQQALDMSRELLGDRHPLVAISLNNLASLYWSQGRYAEAESYFQQSLKMLRKLLGDRHPDVASSLNNLGLLYRSQGRYEEAESYFQQALNMSRELLGDRHPDVAISLNNLGLSYQSQGRYTEAKAYYQQALEMRRELLGNRHPDVAISLNNLAGTCSSQGNYAEAESYFQQALDMSRELLGDRHPDVATSLNNLAGVYRSQGRYVEAESYYQQALEMLRDLLGDRHPDVATSLNNLAALYYSQGNYAEAESYFQQALEMLRDLLGDLHPYVATNLSNLAGLYESQGCYEDSEAYYLQALSIWISQLGQDHPQVSTIINNLLGLIQTVVKAGQEAVLSDHPLTQVMVEQVKAVEGDT